MPYLLLLIITTALFASYNPFFQNNKSQTSQRYTNATTKTKAIYTPKPKRKNIQMVYFGYIDTKKGKFALVSFQNKNIIIKVNDSLYKNEEIFKIKKITSNYILLKDRYNRYQSVYFSSKESSKL